MNMKAILLLMVMILPVIVPMIESEDLDGTFRWVYITLPSDGSAEDHARVAFEYFFANGRYGVPESVEVLDIRLEGTSLTVDVSDAILSYGGSAFERALVAQLIKIAGEVPGVDRFTLAIENEAGVLVYGTVCKSALLALI